MPEGRGFTPHFGNNQMAFSVIWSVVVVTFCPGTTNRPAFIGIEKEMKNIGLAGHGAAKGSRTPALSLEG